MALLLISSERSLRGLHISPARASGFLGSCLTAVLFSAGDKGHEKPNPLASYSLISCEIVNCGDKDGPVFTFNDNPFVSACAYINCPCHFRLARLN